MSISRLFLFGLLVVLGAGSARAEPCSSDTQEPGELLLNARELAAADPVLRLSPDHARRAASSSAVRSVLLRAGVTRCLRAPPPPRSALFAVVRCLPGAPYSWIPVWRFRVSFSREPLYPFEVVLSRNSRE